MGLEISGRRSSNAEMVMVHVKKWLTADRDELVDDGDPRAAVLYCTPGSRVPADEARRLGLVDQDEPDVDGPQDDGSELRTTHARVAELEKRLTEVTSERDELRKQVDALKDELRAQQPVDDGDQAHGDEAAKTTSDGDIGGDQADEAKSSPPASNKARRAAPNNK